MTKNLPTPGSRVVKTPPFLLLGALLFWGWQSDLLAAGAVMGLILESSRVARIRWELSDEEFRRIFTFCTVLAFAMTVFAFTSNAEGGSFSGLLRGPAAAHNASVTSLRASLAFFRWLPLALFAFVAAQLFSTREKIPWTAVSVISGWRARRGPKPSPSILAGGVNFSYPYFIICLFSAGIHPRPETGALWFFAGLCVLMVWALWQFRSWRFGVGIWICAIAVAAGLGFSGQLGIAGLEQLIQNADVKLFSAFFRQRTDPRRSSTAIGSIGELKLSGQIIIRLHTDNDQPPPTYLREASYRAYHSEQSAWTAGTLPTDFQSVSSENDQTTWVLVDRKTSASANLACYLNGVNPESHNALGLLPLPTDTGRLENLNTYALRKNSEGAVLAEGPGLVIFDALYGTGATGDAPPDTTGTNRLDLTVPTNEVPALEAVIAEMKLSHLDERHTLQAVAAFFQNHFKYSVWLGEGKRATTNQTALARFLLRSRSGHCEYFATATVLLLRELKIPARYAVGYAVHEKSGKGYVVRERDAHAWCLVWNPRMKRWEDFDTTPTSWVAEESRRASPLQWLSDARSWIAFQISKFLWGQTNLREYILWGLLPVLAVLLYQIVFRRGKHRRQKQTKEKMAVAAYWPGLDSEFYLLEAKLAARGVPRQPAEPLSVWLARAVEQPSLRDLRAPLRDLLQLHYRHRFDPLGLSQTERTALNREARTYLEALSQTAGKN